LISQIAKVSGHIKFKLLVILEGSNKECNVLICCNISVLLPSNLEVKSLKMNELFKKSKVMKNNVVIFQLNQIRDTVLVKKLLVIKKNCH